MAQLDFQLTPTVGAGLSGETKESKAQGREEWEGQRVEKEGAGGNKPEGELRKRAERAERSREQRERKGRAGQPGQGPGAKPGWSL